MGKIPKELVEILQLEGSSKLPGACIHKKVAETQHEDERKRGLSDEFTNGYENQGCYDCDGFNEKCSYYLLLS
ncbi:MAG: hypothetical protein KJ597_04910 [Nanoarchaeota archaeon]|nr:hypothetical protein [Nanoarchaeota archaeon]MBU1622885.1 hypothetical protein [Nanoarchaeota archaeon]